MKHAQLLWLAVLALGSSGAAQSDVLVSSGASWNYLDDGSDQGSLWQATGFNDGTWTPGNAQLGYGDADEATVVSFGANPLDKHITTYFRHEFLVPDASLYAALTVELLRDDGAAVYLNGVELLRSNLPAGVLGFDTLAGFEVSGVAENTFQVSDHASGALQNGTNVIAVELHQADPAGEDISFDLQLIAHYDALLYRAPYLQKGSDSSLILRWRTFPATDSTVWFGPSSGSLSSSVSDAALVEDHSIELTGLTADSTYFYAIGSSAGVLAGADAQHYFVTHPVPGDPRPARYWALGDSGTASAEVAATRDAYESFTAGVHTDLWLMLGDNAYFLGTDNDYQLAVFDYFGAMLAKSALWPARGNWDTNTSDFYAIFDFPMAGESGGTASGTEAFCSFDHGRVHFICLDTRGSDRSVGGPMWTWLQSDIAATSQEWIIAYWHHAPYSKGGHDSDVNVVMKEMRENFGPLLEAGGADLVLTAHSHSYERSYLLDGHYGLSGTLAPSMLLDSGDGSEGGDGAYNKVSAANSGTVYVVCGSSGGSNPAPALHPAMHKALGVVGSVVVDVDGGRMDVRFLSSLGVVEDHFTLLSDSFNGSYCVALPHAEGCAANMLAAGTPSVSSAAPFLLQAAAVRSGQFGLLFYGYAPTSAPFSNGLRCVTTPIKRTAVQSAGGVGACSGAFSYDFNTRIQSGVDPGLVAGTTVYSQYWFRDPPGSNMSDAYQFVIEL